MSSYIDHYDIPLQGDLQKTLRHSWRRFTEERLRWAHGDARAAQIAAGAHAATLADIARWNALGRRAAA